MGKKGQFVPVFHLNTLGDLTGLLNYNCRVLDKQLTKLTRRNRSVAVLAIAAFGYAVWAEIERRKQEEEVYQLSVRVKKLEYGEGEYIKVGNALTEPMTSDDSMENYWFTPMYFSDVWQTRRMIHRFIDLFEKEDK